MLLGGLCSGVLGLLFLLQVERIARREDEFKYEVPCKYSIVLLLAQMEPVEARLSR